MHKIFVDFFKFWYSFHSPWLKRNQIIPAKKWTYELSQEFPNEFRVGKLKSLEFKTSNQLIIQNFYVCASCKTLKNLVCLTSWICGICSVQDFNCFMHDFDVCKRRLTLNFLNFRNTHNIFSRWTLEIKETEYIKTKKINLSND